MVIKMILRFVILFGVILAIPFFVPGIDVHTTTVALIAAGFFAIVNTFIKPILKFLLFPLNLLTLGLFGFLLNAILFWIASMVVPGFDIVTYTGGMIGSLVMAVVLWILDRIF